MKKARFPAISIDDWLRVCQNTGFGVIASQTTADGLGREGIVWLNWPVKKVIV